MDFLQGDIAGIPGIVAFLGAAVMFMVLIAGMAVTVGSGDRRRISNRVNKVTGRSRDLSVTDSARMADLRLKDHENGKGSWQRLLPKAQLLRVRLKRTGYNITPAQYLMICAGLAGIVGVATHITLGFGGPAFAIAIGVTVGMGLPHMVVGMLVKGRRMKFINDFPEAIDLIVRGLKSGLPVTESMKSVSVEIPDPVGREFRFITEQLAIGKTLDEALWAAAENVGAPEFRFFVVSMSVQRETGGNLSETLENLADILRKRRQMKLKVRALSSEARASALILGILPFAMFTIIYLVNAGYLNTLFTDTRGLVMLGFGLTWLAIGFGVMAKMVRFEV